MSWWLGLHQGRELTKAGFLKLPEGLAGVGVVRSLLFSSIVTAYIT